MVKISYIECMKIRLIYAAAIICLAFFLLYKIRDNLSSGILVAARILSAAFFIIFGTIHLYQGLVLKKVKVTGRFGASDTYCGKSTIIQGILVFALFFIFALTFLIDIKEIIYLSAPILVAMVVLHFIFPPKYRSPNIKLSFLKKKSNK